MQKFLQNFYSEEKIRLIRYKFYHATFKKVHTPIYEDFSAISSRKVWISGHMLNIRPLVSWIFRANGKFLKPIGERSMLRRLVQLQFQWKWKEITKRVNIPISSLTWCVVIYYKKYDNLKLIDKLKWNTYWFTSGFTQRHR